MSTKHSFSSLIFVLASLLCSDKHFNSWEHRFNPIFLARYCNIACLQTDNMGLKGNHETRGGEKNGKKTWRERKK